MATQTTTAPAPGLSLFVRDIGRGLIYAAVTAAVILLLVAFLSYVLGPLLASVQVTEDFTGAVTNLLVGLLPPAVYFAGGIAARRHRKQNFPGAVVTALLIATLGYALMVGFQYVNNTGAFRQTPTLGFEMNQTADGIEVAALEPGGAAETAGLQVGDVVTALRRNEVTADELATMVAQADVDSAFRLRLLRGGEEMQLTVRSDLAESVDTASLGREFVAAVVIALVALITPAQWTPYLILGFSLVPLLVGYLWLIIATFSSRTHGLMPVDVAGNIGGWTLSNWAFLTGADIGGPTVNIWRVTLNSLGIAVGMTIASLTVCSMAGYALSRMHFPGRRLFLSMTLVLHGFPAVTLLIPIFLVLLNLGNLPLIGDYFGYNTVGGIALVMVAFELPLGVWLMKGFFDNISWDMERSALIDGASRWRTFWEIILPQIRPGLLALGIFSFIGGWNAYLIPATYSVGTGLANLPVYINQISGELSPVNWNQVAAVGLFQLIPIFCFFIFAQEYLLNIYAGGTKGSS